VLYQTKRLLAGLRMTTLNHWINTKRYLFFSKHAQSKSQICKQVSQQAISSDMRFEPEVRICAHILSAGQTVFDIGAHTGFYSAVLEPIVGSNNLYLFEPLPKLQKLIKRRFPFSHAFPFALSNENGSALIRVPKIKGKSYKSRATLETGFKEKNQTGQRNFKIHKITLDEFITQHKIGHIDFIKIDVEGHELSVLQGGVNSIKQFRPSLLIEIEQRHHQQAITEIFNYVKELGYQGFYLNPETVSIHSIQQYDVEKFQDTQHLNNGDYIQYINNFFFFPDENCKTSIALIENFLQHERDLNSEL